MHELSVVEELVAKCRRLARGRRVMRVWARCPEGMDTDELVECFDYVVAQLSQAGEGAFEGAGLRLETVPARIRCACGFEGRLVPEDIAGHMGICPGCGRVSELSLPPLELLGLSFAAQATTCGPPA